MKNSRLLWQTALIVLPVAILSGIGLYFLREDQAFVEQGARDRARVLAPELTRLLGQRLGEAIRGQLQGEIVDGQIQSPRDYPRLPQPADWPNKLTSDQARLWDAAQEAIFRQTDEAAARKALSAFAVSGVPAEAQANAEFGLLVLDSRRGVTLKIVQRSVDLARRSPEAQTESGTPIADLALLLAMRNSLPEGLLPTIERHVREHPSFLTPDVVSAAKSSALTASWSTQERALTLMRQLVRHSTPPAETWIEADGQPYLVLSSATPRGWRVTMAPGYLVERALTIAVDEHRPKLPGYAGAAMEIGGKRIPHSSAGVLASSGGRLDIGSAHPFTLRLDLASPELLYTGYRRRVWLTAGLILSAALTALLALMNLWKGFRRQVQLSEMKSNFVSSVSHELRAPIAAVRLMAESLDHERVMDEPKRREYFRLIVQECRRLSSLVENVLDFSSIDQGRKRYTFEPLDLVALIRQTVALMEPCAAEREVTLDMADPPPRAGALRPHWDDHAVKQALVNLLDNAIKHSPVGASVKVEVELLESAVCLWVVDRGEGIPPEARARIFDLFYRHGSELRRETKGSGIGLSIVKHIAEAHGGRALVQSVVGQGSRFGLELPLTAPAVRKSA